MTYSMKSYKEDIDNLHDRTSNSVIDLYEKSQEAEGDLKIVYEAMIDFYMKLKQAMDTTYKAMEKAQENLAEYNRGR